MEYSDFKNHCANIYYTGGTEDLSCLDIQSVRYFMPLVNGYIDGIYKVSAINEACEKAKCKHRMTIQTMEYACL